MKKIFLVLFAGMLQSCSILLFGGLGLADILGGSFDDPVGAQVNVESKVYDVNPNSSVNTGLGVSVQGGSYNDPAGSGAVHLMYLNVPVLYNYRLNNGIYGEIGLQPGFAVRAKDKFEGTVYDYMDHVNKFQLGLPVGVGYHLNDQVSVGVRATYGITNVEDADESYHNFLTVAFVKYQINWTKK